MDANPELCSILEWDSAFFGMTIARFNGHRLDDNSAAQLMRWCHQKNVKCLYFLADCDHTESIYLAQKHGFSLTDIRMVFERSIQGMELQREFDCRIRDAIPQDLPNLRKIAASSFLDSRFYFDDHFPREKCNRLYEIWIENSLSGSAQAVLVTGEPGEPKGFITCNTSLPESKGQIGLIGIKQELRGQGIGLLLVLEALQWFSGKGMRQVEVVTQGRNLPAQRLYQKCGFLTQKVQLWYHYWFGE